MDDPVVPDLELFNNLDSQVGFSVVVTRQSDGEVLVDDEGTLGPFEDPSNEDPANVKRYQDPMKRDGETYLVEVETSIGFSGSDETKSCGEEDACGLFVNITEEGLRFQRTVA